MTNKKKTLKIECQSNNVNCLLIGKKHQQKYQARKTVTKKQNNNNLNVIKPLHKLSVKQIYKIKKVSKIKSHVYLFNKYFARKLRKRKFKPKVKDNITNESTEQIIIPDSESQSKQIEEYIFLESCDQLVMNLTYQF